MGGSANDTAQWRHEIPMRRGSRRDRTRATRLILAVRKSKPFICLEVVMRFACVAAIALCIGARPQAANAQIEQMEGKSIIVSYRETIYTSSGKTFVNNLSEKIYISDKQNIFLRVNNTRKFGSGGSETRSDSFDTVGDRQGVGEGSRTKFAWTGNGLVRSWTNKEVRRPNYGENWLNWKQLPVPER